MASELCWLTALGKTRAQRRPGACRPHGPPAEKNAGGRYHRFGSDIPALPARWFSRLYVLSLGTGCLAPIASVTHEHHRRLGLSVGRPGPHDFTSVMSPIVSR